MAPLTSLLLLSLTSFLLTTRGADPDPLQDFCVADYQAGITINGFPCKLVSSVVPDDFFFSGLAMAGNTNNMFGSNITAGNAMSFAGVNTLGVSMNRVDIAPGGVNPLHIHPHATEIGFVVQGTVLVGFISTANVYYSKVLKAGENFVIPRGLVHFEFNVGNEPALEITAFNSQLPGVVVAPTTLFVSKPTLPIDVLTKNFQVDASVIQLLESKLAQGTSPYN